MPQNACATFVWKELAEMRLTFILSLVGLLSLNHSLDHLDPITSRLSRITAGSNAAQSDFPYIVSIRLVTRELVGGFGEGFFCTGVLVSPRDVLTSASCVLNGSGLRFPEELRLVLGITSRTNSSGAIVVEPKQFWVHYKASLAFLRLKQELVNVRTVVLNNLDQQSGKMCLIAGWGANSSNSDSLEWLQKLDVRIHTESYSNGLICAEPKNESAGVCFRDLGVPLLCDGSLVGVLVNEPKQCGGQISEFASVRIYYEWIESQIARASAVKSYKCIDIVIIVIIIFTHHLNSHVK
ncbi:myeloblastin-like [Toxorhynchites rutilus septentrionalis]|uniref:myeloblastin-like n=1 Tax=Toxorhynchites rutilus septentrionalis TaxID=329112 RepID=UPI002479B196|nr:myeloblastin-like [Toxorhynchites rutilus septentrionalis]